MTSFTLNPGHLSLVTLKSILSTQKKCVLDKHCIDLIEKSEQVVHQVLQKKQVVYGINTGFGMLAHKIISEDKLTHLQRNIVLSHACGTGPLLDERVVKQILLLKINSLARGYSGVRLKLIEMLCALYNASVLPCIPAKGSVGASGDLVPLAHLSLPLIGVGDISYQGRLLSAQEGLQIAGCQPIELAAKEGLALLNGLQVSTAICLDAYYKTENIFELAVLAGALSTDAAKGSDIPFDSRIHEARGYKAQIEVASKYRALLKGSEIRASHIDCTRVQDPYSLRCQPQIMGAVLQQMNFVAETLEVEINAVSDNPLIFADNGEILSGGNFHGEMIAMAADNLALAIAEIGSNSERRISLLIDKNLSGLPAFLVKEGGINSGFMVAHVTAAAAASENKSLAHPRSVDSLPTSANQEDHVSMSTNAALRLHEMIDNTATIIAIEFLAACQGLEFLKPLKTSISLQHVYNVIRNYVEPYENDRYFYPDISVIKAKILDGSLLQEIRN